jgi:hypothetical protein
MAYDEELANRIREFVQRESGVSEKRMFGGLAFLINGNMAISASRLGGVLLRVDPTRADALCREPHVERAVMGGREMNGWLRVGAEALDSDGEFERWVGLGVAYARSLPSK